MQSKNQGFTLIELIIVIVILGILAVTAAPKFINLSGDARAATIDAAAGSIKSANNLVNARALAQSKEKIAKTVSGTKPKVGEIDINYGYAIAGELKDALDFEDDAYEFRYNNATQASANVVAVFPNGATLGSSATIAVDSDGEVTTTGYDQCYVTYTEAASAGAKPRVVVVTSGCK